MTTDSGVSTGLWMFDDARARTFAAVDGLAATDLDAMPVGGHNAIGSLLYHLADAQRMWLYERILERPSPEWTAQFFPHESREENGRLTPIRGLTLAEHLDRLRATQSHFLEELSSVDDAEYRRPRTACGDQTLEWVIHHLRDHEAEHRGQIEQIRTVLSSTR
jgi:uncharacterized damage-inducible protein DinB